MSSKNAFSVGVLCSTSFQFRQTVVTSLPLTAQYHAFINCSWVLSVIVCGFIWTFVILKLNYHFWGETEHSDIGTIIRRKFTNFEHLYWGRIFLLMDLRGREERKRNINRLPPTHDPSVHRTTLQPAEPHTPGKGRILIYPPNCLKLYWLKEKMWHTQYKNILFYFWQLGSDHNYATNLGKLVAIFFLNTKKNTPEQ